MQFVARRIFAKSLKTTASKNTFSMFRRHLRLFGSTVIKCPTMGDSITEGTIQEFQAHPGTFVARDDIVAVIETDKVMVDIRAPSDGVINKYFFSEGDVIEVGADFFEMDPDAKGEKTTSSSAPEPESSPAEETKTSSPPPPPPPSQSSSLPPPPPPPRRPSIPTKRPPMPKGVPPPPKMQVGNDGLSTITGTRTETHVKMSRMRQTISRRLKEAQNTAAMLTTFNEIDMSAFMDLRKDFQAPFQKKHGVKLGFMGAFVRGVVQAVKEQPVVNSVIENDEIVYKDYVDISVAVATPTGLVVPVLRNCEKMGYADVEQALVELSIKARAGKIGLEDMQGGTFTITNGGVFGSMMGTPLINPPQSAILGMHSIKNRAVVVGDKIVARPIMYVALTYDHRLIDGREAVLFLRKIKDCVENPNNVLFDL